MPSLPETGCLTIWTAIDGLIGVEPHRDLKQTLRARLAITFSVMLTLIAAGNALVLLATGDGRPGMLSLSTIGGVAILISGLIGVALKRPAVTMTLIAVCSVGIYAAAVYGNRGTIPPALAYLPCILLGFYQFWGPRILLVAVPAAGVLFASVCYFVLTGDGSTDLPVIAIAFALSFACVWLVATAAVFGSVQALADSQLREANESMARALADSIGAQRGKSEFLANVGHEVRTPLNGVLGMADVMHRVGGLAPDQAERLDLIRESGATLLELLNDILDQSKIETGQVVAEVLDFDLAKLIDKTAASWRPEAESRSLDLHVDTGGLEAGILKGDPLRLRQILNNLVSNALKFTDRGSITICASQTRAEASDGWLTTLSVTDTGSGISPDKLETIFEPFHQADASITRRYGGTGLGLSISRRLARLMGGDLEAASQPGSGSRFALTLTLQPGQLAAEPETAGPGPQALNLSSPIRVLSVDDVATNHIVMRALLEQVLAGGEVSIETASSGADAVRLAGEQAFDLIFMDIQMPEMDGVTATRLIRTNSASTGSWIVAVSAIEAEASARLLPAELFDAILPKPTTIAALQTVLQTWQSAGQDNDVSAETPALARPSEA